MGRGLPVGPQLLARLRHLCARNAAGLVKLPSAAGLGVAPNEGWLGKPWAVYE
jgi:hypothetical protein